MFKKIEQLARTFVGHSSDKDKNNSMKKKYPFKSIIGMQTKQVEDFDQIQREEYIKLCKLDKAIKIKNIQKRRQSSKFVTIQSVSDDIKTRTSSFQGSNSYVQLFFQQKRNNIDLKQINAFDQANKNVVIKLHENDFPFSRSQTKQSYTQQSQN